MDIPLQIRSGSFYTAQRDKLTLYRALIVAGFPDRSGHSILLQLIPKQSSLSSGLLLSGYGFPRLAGKPAKQRVWPVSDNEPVASAFVTGILPATQHVTPDHTVECVK